MEQHKTFFKNSIVLASLGALMALAVACGDDDDSGPKPGSGGTKNTAGTSNNNPGGENTGATANTGGTTNNKGGTSGNNTGGKPDEAVAGGGAGPTMNEAGNTGEGGACTDDGDMGCYKCAPKTHEQFLNACPTTGCEPFDNDKLTSIKNGKLPELP